jgi:hypothetical protein
MAGIIGITGIFFGASVMQAPVNVILEPTASTHVVGDTFVATLKVKSNIPVNVFKGLLVFDPDKLAVSSIDYNTSIANLWAEEPWYSNGEGTINFTGGSTATGGFTGEGTLITITFTTKATGEAKVRLTDMRVLKHDGLGTEAPVVTSIESVFAVEPALLSRETVFETSVEGPVVIIIPEEKSRDLNGDGKQSMADFSILMTDMMSKNLRSDLNGDGAVNLSDLSILTQ